MAVTSVSPRIQGEFLGIGNPIDKIKGAIAGLAKQLPGYPLLTLILGKDPVSDAPVQRNATNLIRGLLSLVPNGDNIFNNLQQSGTLQKAFDWFNGEVAKLNLTGEAIKGLFGKALNSLGISDAINPVGAFEKVKNVFVEPIGRIKNFAVSAGTKVMEFAFEGFLNRAGGAGAKIMGILRKAGGAFTNILKDPVSFCGNLVGAVRGGCQKFSGNAATHLKNGLTGWLFGALAGAGLTLPGQFDTKGIVSVVLQVLGATYERLRGKLANKIGEQKVGRLEKTFDFLRTIVTGGLGTAWQKISEFGGNLQEMVIGGIKEWVMQSVITSAVTKLISMFNPAGAIIQAAMAIYNTVMFFIERGSQIAALAEAVFNSIGTIAAGNVAGAANYVEQTMGRSLPVMISFLARLIGLGGVSEHIKNVIKKIQTPIENAMNKLANFIGEKGKSLLGKGKEDKNNKDEKETGKYNKSESEKKHAEMGNGAAQQLAKKSSQKMPYEEIRASKEKEARALENKYNKELEKPVKMTITFKSPEEDKKDGDMDFHIHIGPNDFDTDGAVQGVGEQNSAERFKEELAKADPAAQPDMLKALKQNAKEYDKLESWEAVKAKLSKDGRVKDFLEKPLLKEHKFGLQAHTNQAVPAVNRIIGELGDAAPQSKAADELVTNYKDQVHSSKAPFKDSRQHLANQVFDVSQKSAASNALYTEFKEKLEKGDNDLDHTLYYPEHIGTKPNGKGTQITYVTRAGKSFRVNLDENQIVRAIKGFDLQLKGDAGIDNRGTTQDPDTKVKGKGQHSSHLIADQFMGSGYKKALNLIAASSEFNLGPMSTAEKQIKAFVLRNRAITFDMQVTVTWDELDNDKAVGQIMQALQALASDDKRSGLKNLDQAGIKAEILKNLQGAHEKLKRCRDVLYKVTVKTETGANLPMPEILTGPDLWLGL